MTPSVPADERDLRVALVLVAFAATIVVAIEFIIVGLLPLLAHDLNVSLATAGHLTAGFGLAAALLGPPLTLAASGLPARRILAAGLLVFAVANAAAVVFPTYAMAMAARIVQGAALPVFIAIASASVASLAAPERRARVLAQANIGFALGIVIAMPAGVAMAQGGGWAPPYLALGAGALVAAALVARMFPETPSRASESASRRTALLREPSFLAHLALSIAAFAAMFAAYTYLAAWLSVIDGLHATAIALALAGFGAAGLIGNALAGRVADRLPFTATLVAVGLVAFAALALPLAKDNMAVLALVLGIWGAAQTGCVTLCQIRVTLAGGLAPAFALSLNISAANLGIAIGAWLGGLVVGHVGLAALGVGALAPVPVLAALMLATAVLERRGLAGAARPPWVRAREASPLPSPRRSL